MQGVFAGFFMILFVLGILWGLSSTHVITINGVPTAIPNSPTTNTSSISATPTTIPSAIPSAMASATPSGIISSMPTSIGYSALFSGSAFASGSR